MHLPPPDLPPSNPAAAPDPPKPVEAPKAARAPKPAEEAPRLPEPHELARDAVTYPWRRGGAYVLVPGVFLALAFAVASWAPMLGLASTLIGVGYFSAFYFQIVETTIAGRHTLPDWPEFSDFYDDLVRPGLQMAGLFILCRLLVYLVASVVIGSGLTSGEGTGWNIFFTPLFLMWVLIAPSLGLQALGLEAGWLHYLDVAVFWLYFPMAVLGVVFHGSLGGALPHRVFPAIARCWRVYLPGVAAMWAIKAVVGHLQSLADEIPYLGLPLGWLLALCLLVMQGRLTGCFGAHYAGRILPSPPKA